MTKKTSVPRRHSNRSARKPIELTAYDGDNSEKIQKAAAALEGLSTPVAEIPPTPAAPPPEPEPQQSTQAESSAPEPEIPAEQLQQQLIQELNALIARLKELNPMLAAAQIPAARGIMDTVQEVMSRTNLDLGKVRDVANDLLDINTWKGAWFIASQTVQFQTETAKRRLNGQYETDEWGYDPEIMDAVLPFFEFMYRKYWRVTTTGLENIPASGRALLVANHSGQLPFDGAMLGTAIRLEHPANRLMRAMFATWFPTLPIVSDLMVKCGQVLATEDNGQRLLARDELVAVFPEGIKGVGKLYKDRYKLARFGRGGFIRMALKSQAPILPVSVVGAEETYISLHKSELMAKLIDFPFFPITTTFPWLGPLGFVPLPTKWYIDIGEPIPMDEYGPQAEQNLILVSQLTDQVRGVVQKMINERLAQRQSVFKG